MWQNNESSYRGSIMAKLIDSTPGAGQNQKVVQIGTEQTFVEATTPIPAIQAQKQGVTQTYQPSKVFEAVSNLPSVFGTIIKPIQAGWEKQVTEQAGKSYDEQVAQFPPGTTFIETKQEFINRYIKEATITVTTVKPEITNRPEVEAEFLSKGEASIGWNNTADAIKNAGLELPKGQSSWLGEKALTKDDMRVWYNALSESNKVNVLSNFTPYSAVANLKQVGTQLSYMIPIYGSVKTAQERGLTSGWTIASIITDLLIIAPFAKAGAQSLRYTISPTSKITDLVSAINKAEITGFNKTALAIEQKAGKVAADLYRTVGTEQSNLLTQIAKEDKIISSATSTSEAIRAVKADTTRLSQQLEDATRNFVNEVRGKIAFDEPLYSAQLKPSQAGIITSETAGLKGGYSTIQKMFESLPKEAVRNTKAAYQAIKNNVLTDVKVLQSDLNKATARLAEAKARYTGADDAIKWRDLAEEVTNLEGKLAQAKYGNAMIMQFRLVNVNEDIARITKEGLSGREVADEVSKIISDKVSATVSEAKDLLTSRASGLISESTSLQTVKSVASHNYRIAEISYNSAKEAVESSLNMVKSELDTAKGQMTKLLASAETQMVKSDFGQAIQSIYKITRADYRIGKLSVGEAKEYVASIYADTLARIDKVRISALAKLDTAIEKIELYTGITSFEQTIVNLRDTLMVYKGQIEHIFDIIKKELAFAYRMTKLGIEMKVEPIAKGLSYAGNEALDGLRTASRELQGAVDSALKAIKASPTARLAGISIDYTGKQLERAIKPLTDTYDSMVKHLKDYKLKALNTERTELVVNIDKSVKDSYPIWDVRGTWSGGGGGRGGVGVIEPKISPAGISKIDINTKVMEAIEQGRVSAKAGQARGIILSLAGKIATQLGTITSPEISITSPEISKDTYFGMSIEAAPEKIAISIAPSIQRIIDNATSGDTERDNDMLAATEVVLRTIYGLDLNTIKANQINQITEQVIQTYIKNEIMPKMANQIEVGRLTEAEVKTRIEELTKTATEVATRVITEIKPEIKTEFPKPKLPLPIPPSFSDIEKAKTKKWYGQEGLVGWEQGDIMQGKELTAVWHLYWYPYNEDCQDTWISNTPPLGAMVINTNRAAQTIQLLKGTAPVGTKVVNMGIVNALVTGVGEKQVSLRFERSHKAKGDIKLAKKIETGLSMW